MGNGIHRTIPFTCARVVSFHLNWGRCCVWWNSFIFQLMMILVLPLRGVYTAQHYISCNHSPHRHSTRAPISHALFFLFTSFLLRSNFFPWSFFFRAKKLAELISRKLDYRWRWQKSAEFSFFFFFNFDTTDAARSFEQHTLLLRSLWHYFVIAKFPFEFLISARSFDKHALW